MCSLNSSLAVEACLYKKTCFKFQVYNYVIMDNTRTEGTLQPGRTRVSTKFRFVCTQHEFMQITEIMRF